MGSLDTPTTKIKDTINFMIANEIANKLEHYFFSEKGFSATPSDNYVQGKRKFSYGAIRGGIENQHYRNHIKTEIDRDWET
jgi:hypothetical protein